MNHSCIPNHFVRAIPVNPSEPLLRVTFALPNE